MGQSGQIVRAMLERAPAGVEVMALGRPGLDLEKLETIAPAIRAGRRVLITAHGNSLRALVKYLDRISDTEIVGLNIPTGIPLVYELEDDLSPHRHYYLGDPDAAQRAAEAVARQTSGKR